jgi:hypothetical protein
MVGNPKGSGQRSNMYSGQRFTNWSPHDPYGAEVETIPRKTRPRVTVNRDPEVSLGIFDRPIADGFVRPWTVSDVADVLRAIPREFLIDLAGVFLLGGTARQRRLAKRVYGMYSAQRIFLFALPENKLVEHLPKMLKPSVAKEFTKFGATVTPDGNGAALLTFDQSSLRQFYLYDVLLHEVGHHVDRDGRADNAERYAHWFADFQHARLLKS